MYKILKNAILLFMLVVFSFVAFSSHAMIASGYVDALILQRVGEPKNVVLSKLIPLDENTVVYVQVEGNNGVYNRIVVRGDDGKFRFTFRSSMSEAMFLSVSADENVMGAVAIPYPFLIPFIVHLVVVGFMRFGVVQIRRKSAVLIGTLFAWHVIYASLYAYIIAMWYQCARMIWASEVWGVGAYLNDPLIGEYSLYTLWGFTILMYLFCAIGTTGMQVRRKPTAKKQTCIKCGYELAGIEGKCPECDLEIGAYIPSKLRINHWYLAAMFVVTFFSPVMVASVYSILG